VYVFAGEDQTLFESAGHFVEGEGGGMGWNVYF
jgi:hypothetical protein